MVKISFIMTVHNGEKFIGQAIDSVLAQTVEDFELIIIDDGSSDSSSVICDRYAGKSANIIVRHTPNRGLSAARNKGLSLVRGKYVTFVDADDLIHPLFAEFMLDKMEQNDAEIAVTPLNRFSDSLKLYRSGKYNRVDSDYVKRFWVWMPGEEATEKCLYRKSYMEPSACGKLFRRSLFDDMRFREDTCYEDIDLIPLLMLKSRKILLNEITPVYHYRQHPESFIHTFSERRLDVLDVTARLSSYMESRDPRLAKAAHDRELSASFNILSFIYRHREEINRSKEEMGTHVWKEAEHRCWENISKYRLKSLLNPRTRLKVKAASLVSYLIS